MIVASFTGATTFFSSCEEPVISDSGLLLPSDNIGLFKTDSLTVTTRTVREEPLVSDELPISLLGSMNDPVFGVTCTGLYTQVRLPQANLNLGDNLTFDSVVFIFRVGAVYGPSDKPTTLKVFELSESLDIDEDYYSDRQFAIKKPEIGTLNNYIPEFSSTDTVIRIRLDDDFGQRLLSYDGSGFFTTTDSFLSAVKGFYITPDEQNIGNGLATIIPDNGTSVLRLYYKSDNSSVHVDFPIDNSTARSNWYFHQYDPPTGWTGKYLVEDFINRQSKIGDSIAFVQPLAGLKVKVDISGYESLGNIAVNKAELVFNVIEAEFFEEYQPPTRLLVFRINDVGESISTYDLVAEPSSHFDGYIRNVNIEGKSYHQYRLNISRYFQRILSGEINNNGLYLVNFSGAFQANRVILAGGTHSARPSKVELLYTKLD